MFWKKVLKGGVALGVISFVFYFCSHLANNYGYNFNITETLGAFGVTIAIGAIVIAMFARRHLPER